MKTQVSAAFNEFSKVSNGKIDQEHREQISDWVWKEFLKAQLAKWPEALQIISYWSWEESLKVSIR